MPAELGFDPQLYPSFRPHQRHAIDRILNTDKPLVIVSSPTGSGKSLTALSVARKIEELGRKTTILTHRIQLQDQYGGYEFTNGSQVMTATGKRNHPCVLPDVDPSITAETADCNTGYACHLMFGEDGPESIPCFAAGTRVLTADLRWVPIETVKTDDYLVGFDEDRHPRGKGLRQFKLTQVTGTMKRMAKAIRSTFEDGSVLVATPEHRVLAGGVDHKWVTIGRTACVSKPFSVWKEKESYDAGWLSGMFDGEGSISFLHSNHKYAGLNVSVAQNVGPILDELRDSLIRNDFSFGTERENNPRYKAKRFVISGGKAESLRFLGSIRPKRLLNTLNLALHEGLSLGMYLPGVRIVAKEDVGEIEVFDLQTTTSTFVAEGFAVHNCPYFRQRDIANSSSIRVLNYPFFILNSTLNVGSNNELFRPNEILICDEGHVVDTEILNAAAVQLTPKDFTVLRNKGIARPKFFEPLLSRSPQVVEWAGHALKNYFSEDKMSVDEMHTKQALVGIMHLRGKMVVLDWQMNGNLLRFAPALPEEFAQQYLLSHAKKTVLMSATIFGSEYWAARMGVAESDVEYIEIPSTFPLENRRIHYMPAAKVNHRAWGNEDELMKLVQAIDWAIQRHLPGKGVVHSVSYRLAEFIQANSRFGSLMIVGGADKLQEFIESDMGVYVSPTALEGLDLADNLCQFMIFAKVPFLNLGDPVVQVQMEAIPEFYPYKAMSAIVQGAGRGVRHERDVATTYIFDSNFARLWSQTKHLLPEWWKEALSWWKEVPYGQ